ncbi:ketoacyl-ACP synthase III family protein [Streptomyces sp. NPDC001922]|uniref:ketoacyl-ACP synthase III family protein n=1 Tax=Streptomyces sp. NPDC001922 TaxID=3364624 RepID=UPI0036C3A15C
MLLNDIYLDAIGVRLGRPTDLADAVAEGRYPSAEYTANALLGAVVSDEFAPDMAVRAVRQAMERSAARPADVRMILHASTYYQGQDMWTPASYIQQQTIGGNAPAVDVDQKSNGGVAALSLGAAYLAACDDDAAVLLTTGERFCDPGFDRYRSESGTVMADGATATVLTRRPGFARVLATVLTADPTLEEMYRGRSLRDAPASGDKPLDMRSRKKLFMRSRLRDLEKISEQVAGGVGDCMGRALSEAKTELAEVRRFVLPNVGQTVRWWSVLAGMGVGHERTTWDFGRGIGHLGAGDQALGLHHLVATGAVEPGDRVVLAGTGYGFNWGCAVVEILDTPRWGGAASE